MLKPDFVITNPKGVYLRRWFITRWTSDAHPLKPKRLPNVMLHNMQQSDDDRALHDHPWDNISIVLWGGYIEHAFERLPIEGIELPRVIQKRRRFGSVIYRKAELAHRLELIPRWKYMNSPAVRPCWTIFITWRKRREWGFWYDIRGVVARAEFQRPAYTFEGKEFPESIIELQHFGMVALWVHWKEFSTWLHTRRKS